VYTLFFLFLPLSAYPKPRMAFREEREDDEDTIMDHADFDRLSWKEKWSLIDHYYRMNSFLVEKNVLVSPNYILPEAMYYVVFRYVICQDIASGRRGRGWRSRDKWRYVLHEQEHVMAH
jgi:hypothetical protein